MRENPVPSSPVSKDSSSDRSLAARGVVRDVVRPPPEKGREERSSGGSLTGGSCRLSITSSSRASKVGLSVGPKRLLGTEAGGAFLGGEAPRTGEYWEDAEALVVP